MRKEWTGWIKDRNWAALEKEAKREPNQALTDTVGELVRGLDEKADLKALKKILFLLKERGYKPDHVDEVADQIVIPFQFALLISPDPNGASVISLAEETNGRVRWFTAHVHPAEGLTRASEETLSVGQSTEHRDDLLRRSVAPQVAADIPLEYAKRRLGAAIRSTGERLPLLATAWRKYFADLPDAEHPARALERGSVGTEADERAAAFFGIRETEDWRLELGSVSPTLRELYDAQAARNGLSEEERQAETLRLLASARAQLFTPSVVADHVARLLDLTLALSRSGDEDFKLVLDIALELEEIGGESAYARAITDRSVMFLVEVLRRNERSQR
jgi:hypothetical protein